MNFTHPLGKFSHPGVRVMCCQTIAFGNLVTNHIPKNSNRNHHHIIMVRSQSTEKSMRKFKVGRNVRLNPKRLERLVEETIVSRYGTLCNGFPRYRVSSSGMKALHEAAEKFLTKMWNEVHDIAVYQNHRDSVERKDFLEWKRKNITLPTKPKLIGGKTLCQLFESIKNKRRRPRSKIHPVGKMSSTSTKDPLKIHLQQLYFDQINNEVKTVEARPYYPCYREYSEGDCILFISPSGEEVLVRIEKKSWYPNFECMLGSETVEACLPGIHCGDLSTAVNIYHTFRNNSYEALTKEFGVIAFKVKLM